MDITILDFISKLSSKSPVPGGGGASSLIGAIGVSLCSMVANLTTGKKKYAEFQDDIEEMLKRTEISIKNLLLLIQKDAEVFEPLSVAYGISKDNPDRDNILENALVTACSIPFEILQEVSGVVDILEQLELKGSKLALSDVGVAASACRCAMEGAAMNVYINTRLMKNKDFALSVNIKTSELLQSNVKRCETVYQHISDELRCI